MVRPGRLQRPNMDFEKSLEESLSRHLNRETGTPPNLAEAIRYSLLAPGKRIRPRLLLETGSMFEVPQSASMAAAIALEMIHCFTLIHDDLPCMDNDDFRRGLPSNHKKFGESLALLAGDALVSLALDAFLDASPAISPELFLSGLKRLNWAIGPRGVVGGQAAEELFTPQSKLADLDDMHNRKTGALFSAALLIPMDFSGISETETRGTSLVQFSSALGKAFQRADDLEDQEVENPLSVLYFMDQKSAVLQTRSDLEKASEKLEKGWGSRAGGLLKIAKEVSNSLEVKS